jgi:hypothetical protein
MPIMPCRGRNLHFDAHSVSQSSISGDLIHNYASHNPDFADIPHKPIGKNNLIITTINMEAGIVSAKNDKRSTAIIRLLILNKLF